MGGNNTAHFLTFIKNFGIIYIEIYNAKGDLYAY